MSAPTSRRNRSAEGGAIVKARKDDGCPALSLAIEMDAVVSAWNAIDERGNSEPRDDRRSQILSARIQAIHEQASFVTPRSTDGAAFLLSLASADHDIAANHILAATCIKDHLNARCERLMNATRVFLMQQAKQCELWKVAAEYFLGNQMDPAEAIAEAIHSTNGKGARAPLKGLAG